MTPEQRADMATDEIAIIVDDGSGSLKAAAISAIIADQIRQAEAAATAAAYERAEQAAEDRAQKCLAAIAPLDRVVHREMIARERAAVSEARLIRDAIRALAAQPATATVSLPVGGPS